MFRIDMPELGEGQFVEIKDPKFIPWGVQKEITALVLDGKGSAAQLDVAEKVALALIKSGHILNEDSIPFTFPLTPEMLKNVPGVVIEKVATKFAELKKDKKDKKN